MTRPPRIRKGKKVALQLFACLLGGAAVGLTICAAAFAVTFAPRGERWSYASLTAYYDEHEEQLQAIRRDLEAGAHARDVRERLDERGRDVGLIWWKYESEVTVLAVTKRTVPLSTTYQGIVFGPEDKVRRWAVPDRRFRLREIRGDAWIFETWDD
ncbi:MAG: hypothetical protein KDC95_21245 [Planctomycetes bacterium]|nr:hypothetical protein [Planctomycetota bacterium]